MKPYSITNTIIVLLSLLTLSSCSKEGKENHYIRLSEATISFTAHDTTPHVIEITSYPANWQVDYQIDWITEVERSHNSLTIAAQENNTSHQREGDIVFNAGVSSYTLHVIQMGDKNSVANYMDFTGFQGQVIMSPGGTYVGGLMVTLADNKTDFLYYPTLVETKTKNITQLGPYNYQDHLFIDASMVTDQGTIVFDTEFDEQIGVNIDGSTFKINTVPGHNYPPRIERSSADGKIWVGYSVKKMENGTNLRIPMKWVDQNPIELPIPDKNFRDMDFWYGLMARGISANGEVIYGSTWDDMDFGMVYWDRHGEVHYVGERIMEPIQAKDELTGEIIDYNLVSGFICWASNYNVSASGKWIAGTWRSEQIVDNIIEQKQYPAFFNTETQQQYIFYNYEGLSSFGATDDGIGFIGIANEQEICFVVDIESLSTISNATDYIEDRYGIVVSHGVIQYISADNSSLIGLYISNTSLGSDAVYFFISEPYL